MGELLPCPFCGDVDAGLFGEDGGEERTAHVVCAICGTVGPRFVASGSHASEQAVTAWNTRHVPELSAEELDCAFNGQVFGSADALLTWLASIGAAIVRVKP